MAPPLTFPALHASHAGIWIASPDGETRRVGKAEAVARAAETPHIMLNAPLVAQRLGYAELSGLDLLELFAFVHPARFVVPTAKGMAEVLKIPPPTGEGDHAEHGGV
ncbi:MAG: ATP-dependent DNA helicase, partial [Sphingorhabdus sp.]